MRIVGRVAGCIAVDVGRGISWGFVEGDGDWSVRGDECWCCGGFLRDENIRETVYCGAGYEIHPLSSVSLL